MDLVVTLDIGSPSLTCVLRFALLAMFGWLLLPTLSALLGLPTRWLAVSFVLTAGGMGKCATPPTIGQGGCFVLVVLGSSWLPCPISTCVFLAVVVVMA